MKFSPLLLLLAACASVGDDPFCLKYENGQPTAFKFNPSRAQSLTFDRNRDRGAMFPKKKAGAGG